MINSKQISICWSDLDSNFYLRHSVFYDFAAQQRVEILNSIELTMSKFQEMKMGPVIFREEAIFRREIKMGDSITLTRKLYKDIPLDLLQSFIDFPRTENFEMIS